MRHTTRRAAAIESAIARWIAARPSGDKLVALVGPVTARVVAAAEPNPLGPRAAVLDPHAALAEVRLGGLSIVVAGAALPVRALAQRLLGGPAELAAPRPLTTTEHAIWALAIAAAIEDLGIAAEVWPFVDAPPAEAFVVELAVALGSLPLSVVALCPPALELRAPPPRRWPTWSLDLPVILARAAVPATAVAALAAGDFVTVERTLELLLGDGHVGLVAAPGAVEATVATGYVPADMALPDEAHLELTVQLGTTRLTVRQLAELAIGSIVPLGRPLAGPFEVRAAGQVVGQGELIDIDGELGVRIVSLAQE